MSAPTPAKRRHFAGLAAAAASDSASTTRIQRELKAGNGTEEEERRQLSPALRLGRAEETEEEEEEEEEDEEEDEDEDEEESNLNSTRTTTTTNIQSSVNAKIGHFERMSLADQRLLLLSRNNSNTCQENNSQLIIIPNHQNPTNGLNKRNTNNISSQQLLKEKREGEEEEGGEEEPHSFEGETFMGSPAFDECNNLNSYANHHHLHHNHRLGYDGFHEVDELRELEEEEEEDFLGLDTIMEEDELVLGSNENERGGSDGNSANCDISRLAKRDCPGNGRHDRLQLGVGDHPAEGVKATAIIKHSTLASPKSTSPEEAAAEGENLDNNGCDSAANKPGPDATERSIDHQQQLQQQQQTSNRSLLSPSNTAQSSCSIDFSCSSTTNDFGDMSSQPPEVESDAQTTTTTQGVACAKVECSSESSLAAAAGKSSNRMEQQMSTNNNHNNSIKKQLLPSTNRLISEHQARQQQATLFRVLSERQRLLDELTADERMEQADLMSGHFARNHRHLKSHAPNEHHHPSSDSSSSSSSSSSFSSLEQRPIGAGQQQQQARSRQLKKQTAITSRDHSSNGAGSRRRQATGGVPLSSVDLSSMSDRMLDDLLGHIASASSSSSSSSSSASSSFSEPLSSQASSSEDEDKELRGGGGESSHHHRHSRHHQQQEAYPTSYQHNSSTSGSRLLLAPSVIGVHEDEQASSRFLALANLKPPSSGLGKCRDVHRRSRRRNSKEDDEDDEDLHRDGRELLAATGPLGATSAGEQELASGGSMRAASDSFSPSRNEQLAESSEPAERSSPAGAKNSVEAVLARMLEALNEASESLAGQSRSREQQAACLDREGDDEEEREHLNELLERGFLHLEQLLNCNLSSVQSSVEAPAGQHSAPARPLTTHHLPAAGGGSHLLGAGSSSSSHLSGSTTMSSQKDSDYGSDTQSAAENCFLSSSLTAANQPINGEPTTTTTTTTATTSNLATKSQTAASNLSPLAIELSFRLAESLRQLAQRQQLEQTRQRSLARPENADDINNILATGGKDSPLAAATAASDGEASELRMVASLSPAPTTTPSDELMLGPSSATSRSCSSAASSFDHNNSQRPRVHQQGAPMKRSIVMINSPDCCKDRRSHCGARNSSPLHLAQEEELGKAAAGTRRAEPGAFRTRVSINASPSSIAATAAAASADQIKLSEVRETEGAGIETQVIKVVSQQAVFERRRSLRSSLRRRPSIKREPGAPRPPSPRPQPVISAAAAANPEVSATKILLGAESRERTAIKEEGNMNHQANSTQRNSTMTSKTKTTKQEKEAEEEEDEQQQATSQEAVKQQKQLQRALVLAQKYNYSPAKLAASKLGSKLGVATSRPVSGCAEQQQQQQQQQQSQPQALEGNNNNGPSLGDFSKNPIQDHKQAGRVQMDISYFAKSGSLTVHLLQCLQLPAANKRRDTSNPYVKFYLLPDRSKSGKRKSSIKRHDLDPQFDQRFTFGPLQLSDFETRLLWLSVWHKDRLGKRNEFLGELLLPLSQVRQQLLESDLCLATAAKWYPLSNVRAQPQATGVSGNQQQHHQERQQQSLPKQNGYCSAARLQQQQAAEQVARKLSEFERKAQQLAASATSSALAASLRANNNSLRRDTSLDLTLSSLRNPSKQSPADFNDATINSNGLKTTTAAAAAAAAALAAANKPYLETATIAATDNSMISNEIVRNLTIQRRPNSSKQAELPTSGQLFVALKFVPHSKDLLARRSALMEGELRVLIKEAKNIMNQQQHQDSKQLPSPQCKCYLLSATGQRVAKQKTQTLKRTANPSWDQELGFNSLRLAQLTGQALEIQVLNRDPMSSINNLVGGGHTNDYDNSSLLGGIRLCKRIESSQDDADELYSGSIMRQRINPEEQIASEREAKLWSQMLERPNIWVYGELPLRQLRPLTARN